MSRTNGLRDPIHFFNERGQSIMSEQHKDKQIADLIEANQGLQARLTMAVVRLRELAGEDLDDIV